MSLYPLPKKTSSQSWSSARASESTSWARSRDFEEIVPDSEEIIPDSEEERYPGYVQDTIDGNESDKCEDVDDKQKILEQSQDEAYIDDPNVCYLIDLLGTNDNLDFSEAILQEMDLYPQEILSENKVSDHDG